MKQGRVDRWAGWAGRRLVVVVAVAVLALGSVTSVAGASTSDATMTTAAAPVTTGRCPLIIRADTVLTQDYWCTNVFPIGSDLNGGTVTLDLNGHTFSGDRTVNR